MISGREKNSNDIVASGAWNDGDTTWEFRRANDEPDARFCTAVALVAITNLAKSEVVLARSNRGWGVLAGHIDPGETLEETLRREALEEGGFVFERYHLFGYREINNQKVPDGARRQYPLKAFMPYYFAESDLPLLPATGEEILESGVFSADTEQMASLLKPEELLFIQEGIRAARNAKNADNG